MIIDDQRKLVELCAELTRRDAIALDTEFVRERTFFIQLGIVQVAAEGIEAVLDPQALSSLEPLFDLVADPRVEKIVHAGEQDFAALVEKGGRAPVNVFDTQIAAALVGYGDQISYAKLVSKVVGVQLEKLETLTDWTARPLTEAQLHYSLEDVRYLPEIRRHLGERLKALGRAGWETEECRRLERIETYAPPPPREYYLRMKTGGLNGTSLGVLREIAAWREEMARSRDIPRGWVMRDQSVLEIARRKPTSSRSLRQIRSLKPQQLRKDGDAIVSAVERGLKAQIPGKPAEPSRLKTPPEADSVARLLEAWLYARAVEAEIAPMMLATRGDLKTLVTAHFHDQLPDLPVLEGWRRELIGQDLLDLLDGKTALQLNADGQIVSVPALTDLK